MSLYDELLEDMNKKLAGFATKLRDDLRIEPPASLKLATSIRDEIRTLPLHSLPTLSGDSPLALQDRFKILKSLIDWLHARRDDRDTFGQMLSTNYIAFVYLGDACFKVLCKELPTNSVAQKCCKYLTDNPVRAFRNALAHGNWRFTSDHSGIDFWARKGADPEENMKRWRLNQNDLSFCQYLAIATAFAAMSAL